MANELRPKESYAKTTSKLRTLWETALRLIGQYENFNDRLTQLENRINTISKNISNSINGV